ncbi:lipopolysaccharide biosynthesis protein [Marinobacter salsuginis]|uniref:lipopolysaccharide biosynthesis protein n=1 Tax=Marinobacter salsuginis TaxID=418719 RepID=UPI001ADEED70|nr:lipopolysaccharide biosynthesis protein [Marinobacter salsuginis]QTN40592.1 lipopolysaccharide biosynthesis protein [Marinobacter salsuginis]
MSASLKVIKSAALLLGMQVVQRGLGIISTLILARLLTPDDFGIIALITIVLQFFELLAEIGNQQYIVQKETLDDSDLNTAWTMDILIKSLVALAVICSAPLLSAFFETPELAFALAIATLALPLRALRTPGMMQAVREINYRPLFRLTLWQKGLSFVAVITIAWIDRSYWAIVLGSLLSAAVFAIGSYRVHPYRPKWSLEKAREQWNFSQWLLLRGIVGFTRSQIDNLIVSKHFSTSALGGYNLVREISLLPALSAIIPMSEPLLASIARVKDDPESLAYRVRFSLAIMVTVLTPLTTFLMLYPDLIVVTLLGEQWQAYSHLLRPFGLFFLTFCLFALISDAIIALGRVRALFTFDLISTVIIITVLLVFATDSLTNMAWFRGGLAIATTIALLILLNHWTGFSQTKFLFLILPGVVGTAAGTGLMMVIHFGEIQGLWELAIRGFLFVITSALTAICAALLLLKRTEEWHQVRYILKEFKR